MKLIVITPENTVPEEASQVNQLFQLGLDRLHLRKKDFGSDQYHAYLQQIDPEYHHRIAVHEQFDLVLAYHSLGLHCKNHVLHDQTQMKRILELYPISLSASVHSWREVEENSYPLNYVFISPVYNSISKKGYQASIDLNYLQPLKDNAATDLPAVVALGGITHAHIPELFQKGFDGVAVLGAIWEEADPLAAFSKIKNAISECL